MVTSPPYPMIEMWDAIFSRQSKSVENALGKGNGALAFEEMHQLLDPVWKETYRILKPGGFACINIGDATRTVKDDFALYTNHMRIQQSMLKTGFTALPCILWRKPTNAPNKFMGSGMLPAGAYVTLEHEYILIFRKGSKREFAAAADKQMRRESAIFWEERNNWFSDVWMDIIGTRQDLSDRENRSRSAAYPFELAYRLINMYSVKGDTVVDPFIGTGTSMFAAIASCRNSIGYEIDGSMRNGIRASFDQIVGYTERILRSRIDRHLRFVDERIGAGKPIKYASRHHGFPVVTQQEREMLLSRLVSVEETDRGRFEAVYAEEPFAEFPANPLAATPKAAAGVKERKGMQRSLFS